MKKTVKHLDDTVPFLVNRVAMVLGAIGINQYRKVGLSMMSMRVLLVLLFEKQANVGELALLASIDRTTLSHILRRLNKRGLVTRTRSAKDNRTVQVTLTGEGKILARKCRRAVQRVEAYITEGISDTQLRLVKDALRVLFVNVQRLDSKVDLLDWH